MQEVPMWKKEMRKHIWHIGSACSCPLAPSHLLWYPTQNQESKKKPEAYIVIWALGDKKKKKKNLHFFSWEVRKL